MRDWFVGRLVVDDVGRARVLTFYSCRRPSPTRRTVKEDEALESTLSSWATTPLSSYPPWLYATHVFWSAPHRIDIVLLSFIVQIIKLDKIIML